MISRYRTPGIAAWRARTAWVMLSSFKLRIVSCPFLGFFNLMSSGLPNDRKEDPHKVCVIQNKRDNGKFTILLSIFSNVEILLESPSDR
jgi:hypothetical protein